MHSLETGITVACDHDLRVEGRDGGHVLTIELPSGTPLLVEVEAPLGLATGLWHPDARGYRALPADWARSTTTSLVASSPVIVAHDSAANSVFSLACSEVVSEVTLSGGVSEEHKTLRFRLSTPAVEASRTVQVLLANRSRPMAEAVAELVEWLRSANDLPTPPVPERAQQPVYSTWYTYNQDINHDSVLAEAELAAGLGCETLFIDDGWQVGGHGRGYAGCGDWTADTDKFPDLRGTVSQIAEHGLDTVIWVAPLLLGDNCAARASMEQFAPYHNDRNRCFILDPRFPQTRDFVAATCRRIVADFGAKGLKIDFLNDAMAYAGKPSQGDIDDVGEAMRQMLAQVRRELADAGLPDAIIEFRQPYISPAITEHGNCLRVGDCPADPLMNRMSSVDLRMWVRGAVVHADPLMWAAEAGAEAVAQQFVSTFFSVPQVSMPLATLSQEQSAAVRHAVQLWREWREVALFGDLTVRGVEFGHSQVVAEHSGRAVAATWVGEPLDLDAVQASEVLVLNGTMSPTVLTRAAGGWTVERTHGPDGAEVAAGEVASGLGELAVPAFGSAVLRRA